MLKIQYDSYKQRNDVFSYEMIFLKYKYWQKAIYFIKWSLIYKFMK